MLLPYFHYHCAAFESQNINEHKIDKKTTEKVKIPKLRKLKSLSKNYQ